MRRRQPWQLHAAAAGRLRHDHLQRRPRHGRRSHRLDQRLALDGRGRRAPTLRGRRVRRGQGGYFQGGGSDYSSYAASAGAAPTALGSNGTRFSVRYGATLALPSGGSGTGAGQGNPYGYGDGNGSYYGGGYGSYYGGGYGYGGYGSYYGRGYGYGGYGSYYGRGYRYRGYGYRSGGLAAILRSLGF